MFAKVVSTFVWKQYRFYIFYRKSRFICFLLCVGLPLIYLFIDPKKGDNKEVPLTPVGFCLMLAYVFQTLASISLVLLPVIEEKTSGVKEFLRIASPYSYLNLVLFFVTQVLFGFFMNCIILLVANSKSMTKHFEMLYMLILMCLFNTATVAFYFVISVVCNNGISQLFLAKLLMITTRFL